MIELWFEKYLFVFFLVLAGTMFVNSAKKIRKSPKQQLQKICRIIALCVISIVFVILVTSITLTFQAGDGLETWIPNFLLFTPWGNKKYVLPMWDKIVDWEHRANYSLQHVPILDYKDYTYERFREATDNWRRPAVVRGMFNGSTAMLKWHDPEYLIERFGNISLDMINDGTYGSAHSDRQPAVFADEMRKFATDDASSKYFFFPLLTRKGTGSNAKKEDVKKLENILLEDLDAGRIFNGFGKHQAFVTVQAIIGKGSNNPEEMTGTFWHSEPGTNYFAQVLGQKRWYFLHPKYSKLMKPIRNSPILIQTGAQDVIDKWMHKIPFEYAELEPGDLLHNPPYYWHSIRNYGGITIGCPLRSLWVGQILRVQIQYFIISIINVVFENHLGRSLGGYADYDAVNAKRKGDE